MNLKVLVISSSLCVAMYVPNGKAHINYEIGQQVKGAEEERFWSLSSINEAEKPQGPFGLQTFHLNALSFRAGCKPYLRKEN